MMFARRLSCFKDRECLSHRPMNINELLSAVITSNVKYLGSFMSLLVFSTLRWTSSRFYNSLLVSFVYTVGRRNYYVFYF